MLFWRTRSFQLCFYLHCIILIIGVYTSSRSLILGTVVSIFFIASLFEQKIKLVGALVTLSLLSFLFFLKFDSSLGRIFIYKISFEILKDNWLFGVGPGNLKRIFPSYQAEYFSHGSFTEKEFLLADNTFYVFNEYYTLFLEFGILSIPILGVLMYSIIKRSKSILTSNASFLKLLVVSLMIMMLVYSCFNISFSAFPILYLFFLVLFIFLMTCNVKQSSLYFLSSNCCILIVYICFQIEQHSISRISNYYKSGVDLDYNLYLKNCLFLFDSNKIKCLNTQTEYYRNKEMWEEAKTAATQLAAKYPSNTNLMNLGLILEKAAEIDQAEYYLKYAINVVPNRLITRYELFKFYKRIGKKHDAKKIGEEMLKIKIKIQSNLSDFIIFDVKNQINKL